MSRKLKNVILFGIFIVILFLSTLTRQFSTDILWKQDENSAKEFQGILFQNPSDVTNFRVSRSSVDGYDGNLIKYNVEFSYIGDGSSFRVLGTPVRQIFFEAPIEAKYSVANLKGDYDKISNMLFNEKLSLKLPLDPKETKLQAKSEIRVKLDSEVENYNFSLYYTPMDIKYRQKDIVSRTSVFLTNAKVDKFTNLQKVTDAQNVSFSDSGFTVNAEEFKDNSKLSGISILNNLSRIIFIVSTLLVLALIWIDKKNVLSINILLTMLMTLTFYRLLDMGATSIGALVIMPIIGYIATCISRLMSKDTLKLTSKELKQNLAYTIVFFIVILIVVIIPRAI